jgi:hypothetical protein
MKGIGKCDFCKSKAVKRIWFLISGKLRPVCREHAKEVTILDAMFENQVRKEASRYVKAVRR